MTIQGVLNDPSITPLSLGSIYDYQIEGESITWSIDNQGTNTSGFNTIIRSTIEKTDNIIDLDFIYTPEITTADIKILVRDYSYARDQDTLASFINQAYWGEITINFDRSEGAESNVNSFVHELGHYLGLGEPAWDARFNQSDTAMSYNDDPSLPGRHSIFFTDNDIAVLLDLHGSEDDNPTSANFIPSQNRIEGTNAKDEITGTAKDDEIFGYDGNDEIRGGDGWDVIRGGSGNDKIWGGDRPDLIVGGSGNDRLNGGKAMDAFEWSQGKNIIEDFRIGKDRLTGFSDKPAIKNKGDKHVIIKDLGAKFILNNVDFKEFISQQEDGLIFFTSETLF